MKGEALDRTMWRARFGRGFGPVVRQTAKRMNILYIQYYILYVIIYYYIIYIIILYIYIIIWDHRRICGPSLTETSLCGAYLYHENSGRRLD